MNYFSQRFKQVVGVTPRQYKKESMNETISLADSAGPLLFLFILLLLVLLVASIIKRVQGRSASKQSGRQEIVSIKESVYHLLSKKLKQTTTVLSQEQAVRQFPKIECGSRNGSTPDANDDWNGSGLGLSGPGDQGWTSGSDRFQNQHADFFRYDEWKVGIKRRLKKEPCQFWRQLERNPWLRKKKMGGFYYPRSGRSDWQKSRSSALGYWLR